MKTYIDRFNEKFEAPAHLNFCAKIGDVIMLNGLHQLITKFGIYDNQMWTEKLYEDGCHLGAGNYENIEKAVMVTNEGMRVRTIHAYKEAMLDNFNRFSDMFLLAGVTLGDVEQHIGQFVK